MRLSNRAGNKTSARNSIGKRGMNCERLAHFSLYFTSRHRSVTSVPLMPGGDSRHPPRQHADHTHECSGALQAHCIGRSRGKQNRSRKSVFSAGNIERYVACKSGGTTQIRRAPRTTCHVDVSSAERGLLVRQQKQPKMLHVFLTTWGISSTMTSACYG